MTGESSRHDVTDRRRERADDEPALEDEPFRNRDEILSVVSHDLSNPIGAIITGVRFLLEHREILEDPDAVRDHLETVLHSAESADRLLHDLLDLTSAGRGHLVIEPREVRLPTLTDEVLEIVRPRAEQAGVVLETDLHEPLPVIRVDRERLSQVLLNLLDNAIKFTPRGGRVELGAEVEDDMLRLRVSDTGAGIPPEEQDRIFERYWHSTEDGNTGTGLGLAIVKEIVRRHGGRVDLESRAGKGSTFIIRLPLDPGGGDGGEAGAEARHARR